MAHSNINKGAKPYIFKNAYTLRKNLTPAEKLLWEHLRKKKLQGFRFRSQDSVSRNILDFYCVSARLGLEIDGEIHNNLNSGLILGFRSSLGLTVEPAK